MCVFYAYMFDASKQAAEISSRLLFITTKAVNLQIYFTTYIAYFSAIFVKIPLLNSQL